VLLSAGLLVSALAVVASTHHVREGYARLQDLELRRWELQEQLHALVARGKYLGGTASH
jgi:cell division protein FtsL